MTHELIYSPVKGMALFRVKSKRRLAEILICKPETLKSLAQSDDLYKCWSESKKNGGTCDIEAPFPQLKDIQKRIATLLQAMETPDYLMAPVKKRSYVTNAAHHIGSKSFTLLDIEDFFPSCTQKKVYWFFHRVMECSADVAGILAAVTTRLGRLPQGSPCSPILAFFTYIDMWSAIANICDMAGNKLSIYADDITISGDTVYGSNIWEIKATLHRHGHRFNPDKERSLINKKVEVTGAIVTQTALLLPNRQHKKLSQSKAERAVVNSAPAKLKLDRVIRGREAQARQILGQG